MVRAGQAAEMAEVATVGELGGDDGGGDVGGQGPPSQPAFRRVQSASGGLKRVSQPGYT